MVLKHLAGMPSFGIDLKYLRLMFNNKINHMNSKIIPLAILMLGFYSLGICQNTKTFSGEYDDGTLDKGYATYSYYEDKATLEYIKHGAFKFTSTSKYEGGGQKVSISGNYKHNKKDGIWAFTITLTDYPTNGGAYITGTKSLTASYTNGKPNGVWTYKYNIKKREKQYSLAGYTWSPYSSVPAQMVTANFNNGVLVGSVKFVNNPPYNEYNSITGQFDSNGNLTGTWVFKSPEKEKTVGFKNGILTSFVVREIASGRITAKDIDNEEMAKIKNDFIAGKITLAELNSYQIKVDTIKAVENDNYEFSQSFNDKDFRHQYIPGDDTYYYQSSIYDDVTHNLIQDSGWVNIRNEGTFYIFKKTE